MSYYDDAKNVDEYIKICEGYNGESLFDLLNVHLKPNNTLLELGSGPGLDLSVLKDRYNVTGSDLSDEFLSRLNDKFSDIEFLKLNCADIKLTKKYDCIYSNKVLHHLEEKQLIQSLSQQKQYLNKDGIIAHSFWIGSESMTMNGLLFTYYLKEKLMEMLEVNYEILDSYSYSEFEDDDSIFIIAKVK